MNNLFKFFAVVETLCFGYFAYQHNYFWMSYTGFFAVLGIILINIWES